MFNPSPTVDITSFWDALGTFYEQLPEEDKKAIQAYWDGVLQTAEASYHNLFQANLSQYFKHTQGYIDHIDETFDIIFSAPDDDIVNVKKTYLTAPENVDVTSSASGSSSYSYRVSAKNSEGETLASEDVAIHTADSDLSVNANTVSWNTVSGADSYVIYGRTLNSHQQIAEVTSTSYNDDGSVTPSGDLPSENTAITAYKYKLPEGHDYMSMPELIHKESDTTLTEGTEYSIEDMRWIRFPTKPVTDSSPSSLQKGSYRAPKAISLIPSLMRLYFPALGLEEDPRAIVRGGQYQPHIDGWSGKQYFEKRRDYAYHLTQLIYGLVAHLRAEPTISNLTTVFALLMDYPFAYEAGTVDSVSGDVLTIGDWSYRKPAGATWSYSAGQQVEKFDILIDGAEIVDYLKDSARIDSTAPREGEIKEWDIAVVSNTPTKAKLEYAPYNPAEDKRWAQSDELTLTNKSIL